MNTLIRRFFLVVLVSSPSLSVAAPVDDLHRILASSKTIEARFEQKVTSSEGEVLQESHGNIALERPNKIRWEAKEPFHYLLVSDGETLWRYDADLDQLNTEAFDPQLANTPAMIFAASSEELKKNYEVTTGAEQKGVRSFTLTPYNNELFSRLILQFKGQQLTAMVLFDNLEQRTDIKFIAPKYNSQLSQDLFRFNAKGETGS